MMNNSARSLAQSINSIINQSIDQSIDLSAQAFNLVVDFVVNNQQKKPQGTEQKQDLL